MGPVLRPLLNKREGTLQTLPRRGDTEAKVTGKERERRWTSLRGIGGGKSLRCTIPDEGR